MQKESENELTL